MKFHNLYVYLLNPIGILIRAALAALVLTTLLGVTVIPAELHPYDELLAAQGRDVLWILFGFYGLSFLFALFAEVLLARRRPLGALILLADYLFGTASAGLTFWHERTAENLIFAAVTLLISILVCVYYWKRRKLFR